MSLIVGTLKVQFKTKEDVNFNQLQEIQYELSKIVEISSSELEDSLDCLNIEIESINPITIQDDLEIVEE